MIKFLCLDFLGVSHRILLKNENAVYRLQIPALVPEIFKDVRAHCYCASLVCTPFIRHARATSFSSACTESKTRQNIDMMTFVSTWCANILVGCSVTPTFFWQITSFPDSFHYTKKRKKSVRGKLIFFSYTIQIGSNWYMDTGERDLEVAFF